MVKKLILIGALLLMTIVILGCTSGKEESVVEEPTTVPEPVVQKVEEVLVYPAPLDLNRFTLNCETDTDCGLVTLSTGAGNVQHCINMDTEYKTEEADVCICKLTGSWTQNLNNGTEITNNNYECRHTV